MCFGEQETTSQFKQMGQTGTKTPAQWLQDAAQANLLYTQNLQAKEATPYGGQRVAPFNTAQWDALTNIYDMMRSEPGDTASSRAFYSLAGDAARTPTTITAGTINAPTVTGPSVGRQASVRPESVISGLDRYMSPYWEQAIAPQLREISRNAAMQRTGAGGIGSAATSAGAFGDARHGILEAENMRNEMQARSDATARGAQTAFDQARGMRQFDVSNLLGADQFNATQNMQRLLANAGYDMQGRLASAGYNMQGQMANVANDLQAKLATGNFNQADANRLLAVAQGFGNLGQADTSRGAALTNMLTGMGQQWHGIDQAAMDAAYQDFLRVQQDPFLRAAAGNQGIAAAVPGAPVTTSSSGWGDVQNAAQDNSGWDFLGKLFGAGADKFGAAAGTALAGMVFSDRRLKENVKPVGRLDNGLPVYVFNYIGDPIPRLGLMADDVERTAPAAVHEIDGFKAVDYALAVK